MKNSTKAGLKERVENLERELNRMIDWKDEVETRERQQNPLINGVVGDGYHRTSPTGGYRDFEQVEAAPLWPAGELMKWRQDFWWKAAQGWVAIENMHPKHLENVVLMIEENPQYFANHIRQEIADAFTSTRHDPTNVSIEAALRASLDLVWLDAYPLEYMTSSPLYRALKERHDGQANS